MAELKIGANPADAILTLFHGMWDNIKASKLAAWQEVVGERDGHSA